MPEENNTVPERKFYTVPVDNEQLKDWLSEKNSCGDFQCLEYKEST